ncbi:IclR family transcriptional regulator [Natribaculum luteum]|uniref:IclR family transcriptional regulator n=1 Tax=Natribaculum luteum TaxID=1586232 RepID=A0ABD5P3C8_9EURY|nr:IclR family transcriptional regulator [Natribaculum luteum]
MENTSSGRLVQSTIRSLRILEYVEKHGNARLTDIASELDIGHSTAHNHLTTLEHEGFLVKKDGKYTLGMKQLKYGMSARRNIPFIREIRRNIFEVAQQIELDTEFLVEENGRVVSVIDTGYELTKYSTIDTSLNVGKFYPMTCTASGKAILAEMTDERVEEILDMWGLPEMTSYSITSRDTLYEQLEQIRERGYSRADQEVVEGFDNIGVVLTHPDGTIIGAVTVGWPTYHFENDVPQWIIDKLLRTKESIEADIAATES